MNSNTVLFRADMNSVIATGHMMRCLSIADAIVALGGHCVFLSADDNPRELVKSRGYELIVLNTDWQKMEEELNMLVEILHDLKPYAIIVDSYQVTDLYLRKLNNEINTYYIDDVNRFDYPVYGIICYAIYAEEFDYSWKNKLLLGPKYAPLRKEFNLCSKKVITNKVENILVMSGGTDQYEMIEKIVDKIDRGSFDYHIRAICGRLYNNYDMLVGKYINRENIEIISSVFDIKTQLEWADIVVTAGGSTLYEISAVGTPAITYSFVDNQLDNVKGFEKRGIMSYAGDARYDDVPTNIVDLLNDLLEHDDRVELSRIEQEIVDGYGAMRIAKEILHGRCCAGNDKSLERNIKDDSSLFV